MRVIKLSDNTDNYIEYFRKSSLFKGITDNEIELFLNHNDYELYKLNANEEIFAKFDYSIFVISGTLAIYAYNKNGNRIFINIFTADGNSLVPVGDTKHDLTVSVYAKKASIVMLLRTSSFTSVHPTLTDVQNKIQQNIIRILYNMNVADIDRSLHNSEPTARNKICKYLKILSTEQNNTTVCISLTRNDLANYLQMDTSTLMRELKGLKRDGIIDYDRKSVVIKNLSALL